MSIRIRRSRRPRLIDQHPSRATFLADVLAGLSRSPKRLPWKYLYDADGARLFDRIRRVDDYYLDRVETTILQRHAADMAGQLGRNILLVEYGGGGAEKAELLLRHLDHPAGYMPIGLSCQSLQAAADDLSEAVPRLRIWPICADYTRPLRLPPVSCRRRVLFFPGSIISHFHYDAACDFLRRMRRTVGEGGGLLIGVDLHKSRHAIEASYDDRDGLMARLNINLLMRINRELGATFSPIRFGHLAAYNELARRAEMHLVSREAQIVRVDRRSFPLRERETIMTEFAYKYTPARFERLAEQAGWEIVQAWTDDRNWFSVQYLEIR
jgi:dimethylhistidine N-methyltransferase